MKSLVLVRHGETEANRGGLFRGRLEIPLSQRGRMQAESIAPLLEGENPEVLFVSPLSRCVETARLACPGRDYLVEERLNNLDVGSWAGVAKERVKREEPELWRQWITSPETMRFPGGEGLEDLRLRVSGFLDSFSRGPWQRGALFTHRSVLKVLTATALGMTGESFWRFHFDNASVSRLVLPEGRGWTLTLLNDTCLLKDFVQEWV